MKASFVDLPELLNEEYVSGKCMYLAAALHRRYGYEIQAAIEDHGSCNAYIGHAWVVEPLSGDVIDIDGQWPTWKNGFLGWPKTKHETGLDESGLKALVDMTADSPCSAQDWEVAVSEAEQLLAQFFTVEEPLPEPAYCVSALMRTAMICMPDLTTTRRLASSAPQLSKPRVI